MNEIKSSMTIEQNGSSISGKYQSAVSSDGSSTEGALTGFVDGDLIAFVVHWEKFEAITSWVGQIEPQSNPQRIKTLWQMTKQVAEGSEWASINAGSDSFTRQPAATE